MKGIFRSLVFMLILFVCNGIHAQMVFDTLFLNEFEITASKVDYTSTVKKNTIDSIFKNNMTHLDLGELLSTYTPVFIRSYGKGSLATASFRGTGSSHTQVLWNGFKINSPMLGQSDFSVLPNFFFDKVELYYGGASLLMSDGGLGGTINLNNTSMDREQPLLSFIQGFGSFQTISTSAGLSLNTNKFSSDTRIVYQSSANDFTYYNNAVLPAENMKQKNADYRNGGFVQQFGFSPSAYHTFSLISWNMWNQRNIPPIMTNVNKSSGYNEYQQDFFSRNILGWSFLKNRSTAEVKAAFFTENLQYHLEENSGSESGTIDTLINSKNITSGFYLKGKYAYSFQNGFELKTGADLEYDWVNTNNYTTVEQRNSYSVHVMLVKDFWVRLKLSLLLRAQVTDSRLLPIMPLFGVNFKILQKHDLYLRTSVSRNYHLPTLNDLYWNPGGNPSLEPEDSFEWEGGLNYILTSKKHFVFKTDLTVYASKVNNWIQWVDTGNGYWEPQNIATVFSRGLEFTAHISGAEGAFSYLVFAEYAYTRTTNESTGQENSRNSGDQLIYIPLHTANASFRGGFKSFYLEWSIQVVGERETLGNPLPAYMLNNLSLGKKFNFRTSGLNLRFKVNNIFNTSYQTVLWRAMPGRNFEIVASFNLK